MEDLFDAITRLKKERNAVILAHVYQPEEIQEIADSAVILLPCPSRPPRPMRM